MTRKKILVVTSSAIPIKSIIGLSRVEVANVKITFLFLDQRILFAV
mgnify:CR=1 FL=1